jgi:argininosuccinate lyase
MKLWQGRFEEEQDPVFEKMNRSLPVDAVLLEVDVRASRAHAKGLLGAGILNEDEWKAIDSGSGRHLGQYSPDEVKALPTKTSTLSSKRRLLEKVGSVALKLHTGRSRNDQVATDFRLFTRKAIELILADLEALELAFIENATRNSSVLLPAYTHLRAAQPIRWCDYCLAYVEMFKRDHSRFADSLARVNVLPLGSGAVAGSNFCAGPSGYRPGAGIPAFRRTAWMRRPIAISSSILVECCADHGTRQQLAEDWILYSSTEFGFSNSPRKVTTGSSLMPQKKNPDGLELIRAKAAMTAGLLSGFLSVLKGLPTGYNKDLQEDKEAFLSAFQNLRTTLSVLRLTVRTVEVRASECLKLHPIPLWELPTSRIISCCAACLFVKPTRWSPRPFAPALNEGKQLSEVNLTTFSPDFADLPKDYLKPSNIVARKNASFHKARGP